MTNNTPMRGIIYAIMGSLHIRLLIAWLIWKLA